MSEVVSTPKEKIDNIITTHTFLAAGAGLIPINGLDVAAVTGVQIRMTKKLAEHYGVEFYIEHARGLITVLASSIASRLLAFGIHSAFRLFPEFGKYGQHITSGIAAGAITHATGEILQQHFSVGGTLDNLNIDQFLDYYWDHIQEGKILPPQLEQGRTGYKAISKFLRS